MEPVMIGVRSLSQPVQKSIAVDIQRATIHLFLGRYENPLHRFRVGIGQLANNNIRFRVFSGRKFLREASLVSPINLKHSRFERSVSRPRLSFTVVEYEIHVRFGADTPSFAKD